MIMITFDPWDEVMDFLTSHPTPEQIVAYKASDKLQERARYLLEANRNNVMSGEEYQEMDEIGKVEHFFRLLKARAHLKMADAQELPQS
jgi:hypothetical protein